MTDLTSSTRRHSPWRIWQNPIFLRYCRSRLRPRGLVMSLLLIWMIAGFIVAMSHSVGVRNDLAQVDAARSSLVPLLVVQGIVLFILGTAQVAGGMTSERDEGVIDYQRLLPMAPLAKVFGYLFGLPSREYVMFLATLPFTAWGLWRGGVSWQVWLPLYGVLFSSTLLYHLTGLVTGTVARNRRWAFLASIGLVFCLYTVIPQMARFGMVFFKYLTITPVFNECLPRLLPVAAGAVVEAGQRLVPTAKFFNLNFSEALFTWFSQGGLILTFIMMLCRKWRRSEAHLLGKSWATGFFIWIQVLLLGNALPLIDPGTLFPTRAFKRLIRFGPEWTPQASEAVLMSAVYGLVTLLMLLVLTGIITPTTETQLRGWRRARKQGAGHLPFLADAATSSGFVLTMAMAGAAGWFAFTHALVESRWFPGHHAPWSVWVYFSAVTLAVGWVFQTLLEARGGRFVSMVILWLGVLPLMLGAILSVLSDRMLPLAIWVMGISPVSLPFYATASLLEMAELPVHAARAVPRAFRFWLAVDLLGAVWLLARLWSARRAMAMSAMANPEPEPPRPADGELIQVPPPLPESASRHQAKANKA